MIVKIIFSRLHTIIEIFNYPSIKSNNTCYIGMSSMRTILLTSFKKSLNMMENL